MAIPRSSADYYRRQQRIIAQLLVAVRRTWRRMDPAARWEEQYSEDGIGAQLLMLVTAAQVAAARGADTYVGDVLTGQGLAHEAPAGLVAPAGFAGTAGDGRPVETLLALAVQRAGQAYNARRAAAVEPGVPERPEGISDVAWESLLRERRERAATATMLDTGQAAREALSAAEQWLQAVAAGVLIDTARAAESVATTVRPEVGGYVRMLNPPSCSRCVVLAGRWYRWNQGFSRHEPTCDCRHVPTSEALAGDMTVNPDAYFRSLPTAAELKAAHPDLTRDERRKRGLYSQEDIFTVKGAQAIRDGADISRVVNARRGMRPAQIAGRDVLVTTEATTTRGVGRSLGDLTQQRSDRYRRSRKPRIMPETIYEVATDRDDAIRLLRANGFIT